MNNNHRRRLVRVAGEFLVTACMSGVGCANTTTNAPVHAEILVIDHDVALPGTTSRFDYQSLDPTGHTLWIAHLGDSTVISIDTASLKVTDTITGIGGVHAHVDDCRRSTRDGVALSAVSFASSGATESI